MDFSIAPARIPAKFRSSVVLDLANSDAKRQAILRQNQTVERTGGGLDIGHQAGMFVLLDAAAEM